MDQNGPFWSANRTLAIPELCRRSRKGCLARTLADFLGPQVKAHKFQAVLQGCSLRGGASFKVEKGLFAAR